VNYSIKCAALTRAIVLLSGGIDSATALYMTKQEGADIYTLNMVYTQTYDSEAEASKRLAAAAEVKEHISIYLPFFKDIERRYHPPTSEVISQAYIPARNIVFYGIAAAYAEALDGDKIVFGSNADDAKELPDAKPGFVQLVNELVRTGTRMGIEGRVVQFVNPLAKYGKTDVLKLAVKLEVPLEFTWSCYEDTETPCGKCRGCRTRMKAFQEIGMIDPLTSGN
jgi:7-cyano-7-deazaguanine synthase